MTSPTATNRQKTTIAPTVPGLTIAGSGTAAIGNNLPMSAPKGRIKTILLALLFVLFAGAMSVAGLRFANPEIRSDLVAFTIDSDNQTAIVGDRFVEVGANTQKKIELKEAIPTRSRAVTAAVVRCLPKGR